MNQRKRILRCNMNVTEKYLPTLNELGVRQIEKVKARLCVDGRAQDRGDYLAEEVESPTASIAAIFTVTQIAAMEKRFIMVGDVGTAYLNASMPTDDPDKVIHMRIEGRIAEVITKVDPTFAKFINPDGSMIVRLVKALYGCIQSAKLWHTEITDTLSEHGFKTNPRDPCIFNRMDGPHQFTLLVYVDGLKLICVNKDAVLRMETILRKKYGQFRTTQERITSYLGCSWNYTEEGYVSVSLTACSFRFQRAISSFFLQSVGSVASVNVAAAARSSAGTT